MQDEKTKLEIQDLKIKIQLDSAELNQNSAIQDSLAAYYEYLVKDEKVGKVSAILKNAGRVIREEEFVNRTSFNDYTRTNQTLLDKNIKTIYQTKVELKEVFTELTDATIEIDSPDFSSGNGNWKGIFNDKKISFKVVSDEYNKLVQSGAIEFRKGSIINCTLRITNGRRYEVIKVQKTIE